MLRSLAVYTGILSLSLTTAYAGGLAARSSRASDDEPRPVSSQGYTGALAPRASEGTAFSSLLLGGAASVSQHPR